MKKASSKKSVKSVQSESSVIQTMENLPPLPDRWRWVKLAEVVSVMDNLRKPINSSERQKRIEGKSKTALFPYYGATGQVGWIDDYITEGEYILVGEDGAPFLDFYKEKAYKIKGRTWVNNHAHILKGQENIYLDDFLLHCLNALDYRPYVNGTTRLKLTKGSLLDIPLPLPPLATQQAIVAKIEELFSELDKGIESIKLAQQQLKTYRQSVLKAAFEGSLTPNPSPKGEGSKSARGEGELPAGWKWVKVSELGRIETGTTPSKADSKNYGHDFPFFKPTDLNAGINTRVATDNLSKKGYEKARRMPAGSVLVTCIGATIGKTGLIRVEGTANQQINSITPDKHVDSEFVYYQVIGNEFQEAIKRTAVATTLPILNKTKFESLDFRLPPLPEQQAIVAAIESRLSVADSLEATLAQSLQQADALRQAVLKKGFEGRLV